MSISGLQRRSNFTIAAALSMLIILMPFTAALAAATGTVSGTVTATKGTATGALPPIPGVKVTVKPGNLSAVTDQKGQFSLKLEPGTYEITFEAQGMMSETKSVTLPSASAKVDLAVMLYPSPVGKPVAAIKAGGRAPSAAPIAYGGSATVSIVDSQNLSPSGIRWEILDETGAVVNDPYSKTPKPLQLERSAQPGSSVYEFTFVAPKPGRFSITVFLKNSFSGNEESSATYTITAVNNAPEALPHLIAGPNPPAKSPDGKFKEGTGLKTVEAGDKVYLAGLGIDSNSNAPDMYNPGGRKPDTYGKNDDWYQRQFGWSWKLEHTSATGIITDVTGQLKAQDGQNPTTVQYPWFTAVEAGKYTATLTVSDRDPYGKPMTGTGAVTLTVLPKGKAYADEKLCMGCHKTQSAAHYEGMDCQTCHGPGQAHVAAPKEEKKAAISKSYEAALCGQCHTEYFEWEKSRHSDGYSFGYSEIAAPLMLNCAKCHFPEGFADASNIATEKGISFGEVAFKKPVAPGGPLTFDFSKAPNKIGQAEACTTCHGPHKVTKDNPAGLRTSKDLLCGTCHQEKWQNVLLEGTAGHLGSAYEYAGTDYSAGAAANNPHNTDDKCILCHMNTETPLKDANGVTSLGGHTMRMRDAGADGKLGGFGPAADDPSRKREANSADDILNLAPCQPCHGNITGFDIDGKQTYIYGLWTKLGDMLRSKNSGVLPGYKPGDKCATCHRGGTLPFDDDPSYVLENAYTNYKLVANDRSWGIHNYEYTRLLLEGSIAALEKYIAGK